jgi:hypothetical protein
MHEERQVQNLPLLAVYSSPSFTVYYNPSNSVFALSGSCDGRILGDDRFAEDVLHRADEDLPPAHIPDVLQAVSTLYGLTPEDLRAPGKFRPASAARALAALLVREAPHLSLSELGRHLNRDVAALSQAARRLGMQIKENPDLAARRNALQKMLEKV